MNFKRFTVPILFTAVLGACQTQTVPVSSHALPEDPITISVEQRRRAWIPGSAQGLSVHLGDISRGQVMLSIRDSEKHIVVDGRSVRRGDVVAFEMDTRRHYLQVMELHSHLFDADLAELRISTEKPDPLPPKTPKEPVEKASNKN